MRIELTEAERNEAQSALSHVLQLNGEHMLFSSALLRAVLDKLSTVDGRAVRWRARFRLYRDGLADCVADSDEGRPAEATGSLMFDGLPAVAAELHALGLGFHKRRKQDTNGLELDRLQHLLKGLRPTISRRGGNAVWRVQYTVDAYHGEGHYERQQWLARVDVVRV